jgi:hypothetical protein
MDTNGVDAVEHGRRFDLIDEVLADPPVVHYMSEADFVQSRQSGVWSTDRSCYEFLAERCATGRDTLETGSGVSTILFAAWGTNHTAVTPGQQEAKAIEDYCRDHRIATDRLTFEVSTSDVALPRRKPDPLDLVLIDGGHGFPTPLLDWYYAGGCLRKGGILVVDDLQLPAVKVLTDYLFRDGRWLEVGGNDKWIAYERRSEGPLGEDWFHQSFFDGPPPRTLSGSIELKLRAGLGRARRRARSVLEARSAHGSRPGTDGHGARR